MFAQNNETKKEEIVSHYTPPPAPSVSNGISKSDKIYEEIEQPAEFPGGTNSLKKIISKKLEEIKKLKKGEKNCELIFIVEKDGSITDVKAKGENEFLNKEVIKIFYRIDKKWYAGKINGSKVRSRLKIPLTFE